VRYRRRRETYGIFTAQKSRSLGEVKAMRKGTLMLATVVLLALVQMGCQPRARSAPVVTAMPMFGAGLVVTVYHPDIRTVYVWSWMDTRPFGNKKMTCQAIQLSADPGRAPTRMPCKTGGAAPAQ
jgi:hypothetical protein